MVRTRARLAMLTASLAMMLLPAISSPPPAALAKGVSRFPASFTVENLCVPNIGGDQTLGDDGEFVDFTGWLLLVEHTAAGEGPTDHFVSRFQVQGLSGLGRVSGLHYRMVEANVLVEMTGSGDSPLVQTILTRLRLVAPGAANNYELIGRFHLTINALGEQTAQFFVFESRCF